MNEKIKTLALELSNQELAEQKAYVNDLVELLEYYRIQKKFFTKVDKIDNTQ